MRLRIAVSAAIGVASGIFCWFLMKHLHQDAADFRWATHLAQRLLARQNPYDTPLEQYPLTAALFRAALRPPTAGDRCRPVLRTQFRAAGLRAYAAELSRPDDISRLSLLGRIAYRSVVSTHRRQRLFSVPAARNHGQTADRAAGLFHSREPPRHRGLLHRGSVKPRRDAAVASACGSRKRDITNTSSRFWSCPEPCCCSLSCVIGTATRFCCC